MFKGNSFSGANVVCLWECGASSLCSLLQSAQLPLAEHQHTQMEGGGRPATSTGVTSIYILLFLKKQLFTKILSLLISCNGWVVWDSKADEPSVKNEVELEVKICIKSFIKWFPVGVLSARQMQKEKVPPQEDRSHSSRAKLYDSAHNTYSY